MGIPLWILKQIMPIRDYKEMGAYYAVEERNYSQTDINIAQNTMDYHNATYDSKLKMGDLLDLEEEKEESELDQVTLNVGQWHALATKGQENG